MGQAKSRLERFKVRHPRCCYCGGSEPTDSIDHAPPLSLFFKGMSRPKGLEVPACARCHQRFAPFDDFVSVLVMMQLGFVTDQYTDGLEPRWRAMLQRFPNALNQWHASSEDAWVYENGVFRESWRARTDNDETQFAVCYFAARLAAAVQYEKVGKPLPHGSYISCGWSSNVDLLNGNLPNGVLDLAEHHGFLEQGKQTSLGRFEYLYRIDGELGVFVFSLHDVMLVWALLFGVEVEDRHPGGFNFTTSPSGLVPVNRPWPAHLRIGEPE